MNAPPTACRACGVAVPHGCGDRGFCEKCAKEHPRALDQSTIRHRERRHKIYDTAQWKHPERGTRALMQTCNPQCQAIIEGIQCLRPMVIVHHIVSPFVDLSKGHDPRNLVAVCRDHHPTTEGDLVPRPYAPTRFPSGFTVVEYPHPVPALKQGGVHITEDGRAVIG